tara:strand:+ start:748 stop:963 length:216 start_codon:yes stop_codon:yes gene_type:complete
MKFNCCVYYDDYILLNKEFNNLQAVAEELGLTYNQVADISSKKKKKKDYRKFKYYPTIEINKIYNNNNGKP